jgi:hypothetical protein
MAGGVVAGSASHTGSPLRIPAIVSDIVSSDANGRPPASISKSTQPNAQMSARRSTGLPRACSGLI